jgi:hypothetical protein
VVVKAEGKDREEKTEKKRRRRKDGEEKTERGRVNARASWGAAVLRPYMICDTVMTVLPDCECAARQ